MWLEAFYITFAVAYVLYYIYLFHTVRFYTHLTYYCFCVVVGNVVGGIISLPFGNTADNHFRIFKIIQFMSKPLGIKFTVRHKEILEYDEPFIIISNHQSVFDVLGMSHVWPENCVFTLKTCFKIVPVLNKIAKLCQAIFIDRFTKAKTDKTVDDIYKDIVDKKRRVWIFPEGKRNPETELLPFKQGAFILAKEANIKIVPVVFSQHNWFYNFNLDYIRPGPCRADVLTPVDSSKFRTADELRNYCREVIGMHREDLDREVVKEIYGL